MSHRIRCCDANEDEDDFARRACCYPTSLEGRLDDGNFGEARSESESCFRMKTEESENPSLHLVLLSPHRMLFSIFRPFPDSRWAMSWEKSGCWWRELTDSQSFFVLFFPWVMENTRATESSR